MHIFHNRLVFANLRSPNSIKITKAKSLLLNNKSQYFLQLFHILRLVKGIAQYNFQNFVINNPFLEQFNSQLYSYWVDNSVAFTNYFV